MPLQKEHISLFPISKEATEKTIDAFYTDVNKAISEEGEFITQHNPELGNIIQRYALTKKLYEEGTELLRGALITHKAIRENSSIKGIQLMRLPDGYFKVYHQHLIGKIKQGELMDQFIFRQISMMNTEDPELARLLKTSSLFSATQIRFLEGGNHIYTAVRSYVNNQDDAKYGLLYTHLPLQ